MFKNIPIFILFQHIIIIGSNKMKNIISLKNKQLVIHTNYLYIIY